MNTMELMGLNADGSERKEPVEVVFELVERMQEMAQAKQRSALLDLPSLHEIGYRKGKVQALNEVLEMLRTGKIPSGDNIQ